MTTRVAVVGAGIALALIGQGCGTIVHGTTQRIPIASDPPGARVIANGAQLGTTPCEVELSRKRSHILTLTMDGYHPAMVSISNEVSAAQVGSFLAGGLIGIGVDAMTGGGNKLVPESVSVVLERETPP